MKKKHKHHTEDKHQRSHKRSKDSKAYRRRLGKKLLKSVARGIEKVRKKVFICKENGVSINFADKKSNASALHCATLLGLKDIVAFLLDNGAEVDLRDSNGNTPLLHAVNHHHPDVAKLLVARGANLHATNLKGESPLSLGVANLLLLSSKGKDSSSYGSDAEEAEGSEDDKERTNKDGTWGSDADRDSGRGEREWRAGGQDSDHDWNSHLEAEYSDQEDNTYSGWRDIEEEQKGMEDDSWMDDIAAQARKKYSRVYAQLQQEEKEKEKEEEKESNYRRLLEEEIQKDKEWREKVKKAAAMNNSEVDEENWEKFADLQLHGITQKDIPWPTGPNDNILCIKENLPISAKKQLVRAGLLRWHPDKFMQKFGGRLHPKEKEEILEKVKETSQSINQYYEKVLGSHKGDK